MLQPGTKAPKIEGISFEDKTTLLYFYPKDDTPGCTAEACSFRDHYASLIAKGLQVIGVSPDSEKSHEKFKRKFELPFSLVSDSDKKIVNAYEVWGRKKFMGREYDGVFRTTFIINGKGIIEHVIDKVDTKDSAKQVLDLLEK
jgi:peroxiredoxin Q/BCP